MAKEMPARSRARPKLKAPRRTEWTAAKKRTFLDELASTCNVAASLRAAKMRPASLYRLRRRCAAFRAEWEQSLREGYAKLEVMLLERAMNGTVKTVERSGGAVDKTHEYPDALALRLLQMHREGARPEEREHHPDDIEAVRARIMRKLKAVRQRLDREAAERGESPAGESQS